MFWAWWQKENQLYGKENKRGGGVFPSWDECLVREGDWACGRPCEETPRPPDLPRVWGLSFHLLPPASPAALPGDRAAPPGKAAGRAAGKAGPGHQGGHDSKAEL